MKYRGRNGRTTDGEGVWQHTQREYVSSPLAYEPPLIVDEGLPIERRSMRIPLLVIGAFIFVVLMITLMIVTLL